MALQSTLFSGDPLLEAAAVSDPAHIVPGARGPHVVKIQQALIKVGGAAIAADGVYGPATALAVADFKRKQQPPILNFAGLIDNIIGIKTMAALDALLLAPQASRLQLNFGLDVFTFVDVVVNFIGAPSANPKTADEALPPSLLLKAYDPVQDPRNRGLLRHKSTGDLLLRIAHDTSDFGTAGEAVLAKVAFSIKIFFLGKDPANGNLLRPGKIFVLGTSSGGRNAIDFVKTLKQLGLPLHFVAAIDASFFQADTKDRPQSSSEPVEPIPTFIPDSVVSGLLATGTKRHNFFQRKGNHAKRVLNPLSGDFLNLLFTSNMAGGLEEIHGKVQGFDNHEIVLGVEAGTTDDDFHNFGDPAGRLQAQQLIAKELRGD